MKIYFDPYKKKRIFFSCIKCLTYLCGRHGSEDKCVEAFGSKPQRKETTWKIEVEMEHNIKMHIKETVQNAEG
jgi:hypothetical protein